jgi:predicted ATPase
LVTLLGPGGIGKTSTALAAAWELAGGRPVTFVDLARVSDPAAVENRVVDSVITVEHEDDREPARRLADRLQASTDLVIVDNAEHVLDAVTTLLDQVLQYELKGSFLITSRNPLGLPDEVIVGVPPLELPNDGDDLGRTGRSPSVQLFIDRAKAGRADLDIGDGMLPVVAHICRRLDGLPLAIELAAGRASILSVDDIAARLDDQLRLLRQVRSQRDRRHQSLEVVVGWSVEQLSTDARELFERLSVMAGAFGLPGVERLLQHCDLDRIDALESLGELQEASLLVVEPGGSRFRMLEPIRQVAAALLDDRQLGPATRKAQVLSVTELTTGAHYRRDHTRAAALSRVDDEADQLVSAVGWVAEANQADLAPTLALTSSWWFLTRDTRLGERLLSRLLPLVDRETDQVGWAELIIALAIVTASDPGSDVAETSVEAVAILDEADHPDRGVARIAAAFAQTGTRDVDLPLRLLAEAARIVPADDQWAQALTEMSTMTIQSLWLLVSEEPGDPEPIVARGMKATKMLREIGEPWALGVALGELGRLLQTLGRIDEAEACYEESLELSAHGDYHGTHFILSELGKLASRDGRHDQADQYHQRAMEQASRDGNPGCIATAVGGLADAAEARGDTERARELYQQAIQLCQGTSLMEHGYQAWLDAIERLNP